MKTITNNSHPMEIAIREAKKAFLKKEVPVGAVITDEKGNLIAKAFNQVETKKDSTAHAEIQAIKKATLKTKNKYLKNCNIYVTLEPCSMCASAIQYARIKRLYFGCYDEQRGAVTNGVKIFSQKNCNHRPEIYDGIRESDCNLLLKKFFRKLRIKK